MAKTISGIEKITFYSYKNMIESVHICRIFALSDKLFGSLVLGGFLGIIDGFHFL